MSVGQLWPQIRKLMFENVSQTSDGQNVEGTIPIETRPRVADKVENRYLLQVTQLDAGGTKVELTWQETGSDGRTSTERDVGMEWRFLERTDPASAARIQQAADAEDERAKAQG
jgi:hypothetical protein